MTDQKKQNKEKGGINPMIAAVAGAVVGAGVAVAGTIILEDKKNQEKVKKVLNNVKKQVKGYVENMEKQVGDKKNEIEEKVTDGKKKVSRITKSVKKSLDSAVKDVKKAAK